MSGTVNANLLAGAIAVAKGGRGKFVSPQRASSR